MRSRDIEVGKYYYWGHDSVMERVRRVEDTDGVCGFVDARGVQVFPKNEDEIYPIIIHQHEKKKYH